MIGNTQARIRSLVIFVLASLAGSPIGHCWAEQDLSPHELRSQVESLYAKQTPWREIEWRTCLIEGLNESKETGKPVVLWIFIDRPIDDERC